MTNTSTLYKTWKDSDFESLSTGKANKIKERAKTQKTTRATKKRVDSIID